MLGILVILTISWALLHWLEKKSLLSLGFFPIAKRVMQFATGLFVAGFLRVILVYIDTLYKSLLWEFSSELSAELILNSVFWDAKSVLTEELVFRGALMVILINRIGAKKSILLSAAAFGIYHWFSYGAFGNLIPMIVIFIGTGLMGYAWALAFHKTKSMMLPLGLHLGWNLVQNTFFSMGPLGEIIMHSSGGAEFSEVQRLLSFLLSMIAAPLITVLYVKYLVKEEEIP